jgi:hypothetical protein
LKASGACPVRVRLSRPSKAYGESRPASITSKRSLRFLISFALAQPNTPKSAPKAAKAPRSSPSVARSTTSASSKFRWARRYARLIFDIGGGIPNGKKFKAIQTGGPSGGCLTEEDLDTPIDYDTLIARGSMMGSGGAIVMDEDNCMVDVAHFYMDFICSESCGKCSPCRIGTKRFRDAHQSHQWQWHRADPQGYETLATVIKGGSLCALGQTAANPILSTMKKFPDEYHAHVVDKKCPAHVCKKLMQYWIDPSALQEVLQVRPELPGQLHQRRSWQRSVRHQPSEVHQVRHLYGRLPLPCHFQTLKEKEHGSSQYQNRRPRL